MGPGASVTPPSFERERSRRLDRWYAFETLPVQVRNTFAAGFAISHDRPGIYFTSGAPLNSNKMLEFALEREINDVTFEGPTNSDPQGFIQEIVGSWWSSQAADPTQDDTAYIGVEMYSFGTAPPFAAAPTCPVVQLRQHLKDANNWSLYSAKGDSTAGTTVPFTVARVGPGEGHRVKLQINPYNFTITATVDGIVRAVITDPAVYPDMGVATTFPTTRWGIFVTSGVQAVAGPIGCEFAGFRITSFDTDGPGSGF